MHAVRHMDPIMLTTISTFLTLVEPAVHVKLIHVALAHVEPAAPVRLAIVAVPVRLATVAVPVIEIENL